MTPSARLFARIRRELPDVRLPEGCVLRRTRAGRHQRAAGAWSWWAADERGYEACGSPYSVDALLRAPALQMYLHPRDRTSPPEILPKEAGPGA